MGYSKSEIYGNAALRHEQVRAVRRRRGENPRAVAADYGVAPETIRKIWRGETYTMVSDEGPTAPLPSQIQLTPAELQASFERVMKLAGQPVPQGTLVAPSLEEALKAQALREEAAGSPGLEKLAAVAAGLHRGDRLVDELAGHSGVAGIQSGIVAALGGTSTDGGTE